MAEMTIDDCLETLREESPGVQWEKIAGKVFFWDREKWFWISNPYKDGKDKVWPMERYPELTDAGAARMVWFNQNV